MVVRRPGFSLLLFLFLPISSWTAQPPQSGRQTPQKPASKQVTHASAAKTGLKASQLPNIILITLDTTRADRMGFLGSTRGVTPNLDAIAKQALVFPHAYSHVPITTASHTTILTGTYPQYNRVNDFGVPLSDKLPYLPDLLHQRGYHTGAFVSSIILDPLDGTAPGFDRGFDVYDAGFRKRPRGADRYKTVERRSAEVVNHALGWLSQLPNGPFFLWVHLYDAHDPYDPPSPYKERFATAPYDGEIAYADSSVGKLVNELRKHGLYDETLIAVMADHGESLGAHGENTHGIFLYDETLHVPLMIKLPLNRAAGTRVDARVGLVDVAPTILAGAGLAPAKEMQGQSALELLKSDTAQDRPAYAETDYPHRGFGWSSLRALRTGKYLYIQAPERELYNQASDPGELHNVVAQSGAVADTLAAQLQDFRAKTSQTLVDLAKPDPEQMQKLQSLGYVASSSAETRDEKKLSGADPKSKIQISNDLHDAMFDVEDARYQQAVPLLQRILKEEPNMPVANMQYGIAQARLGNFGDALGPLQKAIKALPDNTLGRYELGLALFESGDWKGAAPEFEAVAQRSPRWTDAHFSLAAVYARIDRVPEAMTELDTTLSLNPDHYRANLLRGRILSLQKNPLAAVPNLEKATKVQPASREAHLFLADAYQQLGRVMDAQHELAEAKRLSGTTAQ
jgi:arylsulfatase A-like enzyme/Flp pilus assembly protein TadD